MFNFQGCENHKMQWLSLFIQAKLYEKTEYSSKELFALAFTEWSQINPNNPIRQYEVDTMLDYIERHNCLFNVNLERKNNKILASVNQLKTWLLMPVKIELG